MPVRFGEAKRYLGFNNPEENVPLPVSPQKPPVPPGGQQTGSPTAGLPGQQGGTSSKQPDWANLALLAEPLSGPSISNPNPPVQPLPPPEPPEGYMYLPVYTDKVDNFTGKPYRETKWELVRKMPPPKDPVVKKEQLGDKEITYVVPFTFDKEDWQWVEDWKVAAINRTNAIEAMRLGIPNPGPKKETFVFGEVKDKNGNITTPGVPVEVTIYPSFNKDTMSYQVSREDEDRAHDNARLDYVQIMAAQAKREGNVNKATELLQHAETLAHSKAKLGQDKEQFDKSHDLATKNYELNIATAEEKIRIQKNIEEKEAKTEAQDTRDRLFKELEAQLGRRPTTQEYYSMLADEEAGKPRQKLPSPTTRPIPMSSLPGGVEFAKRNAPLIEAQKKGEGRTFAAGASGTQWQIQNGKYVLVGIPGEKTDVPPQLLNPWMKPPEPEREPTYTPAFGGEEGQLGMYESGRPSFKGVLDPFQSAKYMQDITAWNKSLPGWRGGSKEAEMSILTAERKKNIKDATGLDIPGENQTEVEENYKLAILRQRALPDIQRAQRRGPFEQKYKIA